MEDKEASYYRLFEVDADSCAQRELAGNVLPLAVILGWPEEIKPNMRVSLFLYRTAHLLI